MDRQPRYQCPRRLLAFRHLREQLWTAADDGRRFITSYRRRRCTSWGPPSIARYEIDRSMKRLASRETVTAAVAILRERKQRRERAAAQDSLAEPPTERLRAVLRAKRDQVMRTLGLEVARQVQNTIETPMVDSKRAKIVYGRRNHEEKCWPYKGEHKNRPAVWRNAGVTVKWDGAMPSRVSVYTSRGRVFSFDVPKRAFDMAARGKVARAAQIVAGTIEIDGEPYIVVADSRRSRARAMVVVRHRDTRRPAYIVVDGNRTELPPRFGRELKPGERPIDRVRHAIHFAGARVIASAA